MDLDPLRSGRPGAALPLERAFDSLRAFVYESSGIFFSERNRDRLLQHLQVRMKATAISDPAEYLALLRCSPPGSGERAAFFAQVTVSETYFFRETELLNVLRDTVLPRLYAERVKARRPKVVIWSAACSSGEEAYTLAILIAQSQPLQLGCTSIVGFDINPKVVERARAGFYGEYSVRHCTPQQRASFFREQGSTYLVRPEYRGLATFEAGNITDPAFLARLPAPDLILCRNVLIYFDARSKAAAIRNLTQQLPPHGLLFLGQTETLFTVEHSMETVSFGKICGYRKKPTP